MVGHQNKEEGHEEQEEHQEQDEGNHDLARGAEPLHTLQH